MSLVRYPIGDSPQVALSAPLGAAERASDAAHLAGGAVEFVSESLGAAFETRDAALEACVRSSIRIRPGAACARRWRPYLGARRS
jgi:hypothetical protein